MSLYQVFASLIPVDDEGNRGNGVIYIEFANELIYTIIETCRQLGATIYNFAPFSYAIFSNGIKIDLCKKSSFEDYYIIAVNISQKHKYLNLHQTMALRYKPYYMKYSIACHLVINKLFKTDIAKYILSYIDFNIDFDHLFPPLQQNRCACISTNLLYNIILVLSDQDIGDKSLNIVIGKLLTLTDTCSTKPKPIPCFSGIIQDIYYPRLEMVNNLETVKYNHPLLENIKYNHVHTHLSRKRIPFPSRNTSTSICEKDKKYQLKYIKKLKYMKKVWSIYSFSFGLIYKLVRENRLAIIANIDIYLKRVRFQIEGYKKHVLIQKIQNNSS